MFPRFLIIDDARETPAHLDGGRQLALPLEDIADGGGIRFGDDEHAKPSRDGYGCWQARPEGRPLDLCVPVTPETRVDRDADLSARSNNQESTLKSHQLGQ
jgi:hypothetical protein